MKIRHLYSFFCRCLCFFSFSRFVFCPKLLFLQYSTTLLAWLLLQQKPKLPYVVSYETNHQTTLPAQATIKQARFYKPCAYYNQLGFNKPAVVIWDSLFAVFGICVLTVVCAICATSVQGRVSKQTLRKSPALVHKQALIENYCFYDQTTQNYSTANNPNKHFLHFTPFRVQNHNKRSYANSQ